MTDNLEDITGKTSRITTKMGNTWSNKMKKTKMKSFKKNTTMKKREQSKIKIITKLIFKSQGRCWMGLREMPSKKIRSLLRAVSTCRIKRTITKVSIN